MNLGQTLGQWASWQDFWHMGGYGLYVWGSYGVTLVLMLAEARAARARYRKARAALGQPQGPETDA